MCLLGEGRASKPSDSCSALAREEQVNCTSDAAGAFLGVFQMSWQLVIIRELQAVCPLLLSRGESSTRNVRKSLIIGKEVRFVLVVACSYHLQPILNLNVWYNCTVLGVLLLRFRSYSSGWLGKSCTSRQTSLSGFSSTRTHFQFARAEFGMQHISASVSGISCLISCSHHICPSLSSNLKSMSVIK